MDKAGKKNLDQKKKSKKTDEKPDPSFPASDRSSFSQPGNDDIKQYEYEKFHQKNSTKKNDQ